ncbi:uroporphyrinogen decarboxylase [Nordella sp. HKS 07]|uniref:uroporphyrinogen decarboxylase n=1 Tax=Nordella sp. HKS 07 TaxID=2712222 RepID=UPI0013E11188|nr:uroporphyrinogen decarboxylase [Nordella sp. HKS 07]QIG48205.1 uroporphyrinogen decarboxylase [Nordella sp. HKS 07]
MNHSALLDVLKGRKPSRRPVWFMRQAGRYLPEYRATRGKAGSFLKLCYAPDLAKEVTLQPLRRFDVDAAIVFADILVVPQAMGLGLAFAEGEGPVVEKVSGSDRVNALRPLDEAEEVRLVCETVKAVKAELPHDIALIGFCGAPWTVASYMIGGGGEGGREVARAVAASRPEWFTVLMELVIEASAAYLVRQIDAGADVVQIFDSWAGDLPGYLQETLSGEPIAAIITKVREQRPGVPVIVFARGAGAGHKRIGEMTGAECLGVETSMRLDWARDNLSAAHAIQGNLDPLLVEAGGKALEEGVEEVARVLPMERHIFNLGHGMRPATPPEHVDRVVKILRKRDG